MELIPGQGNGNTPLEEFINIHDDRWQNLPDEGIRTEVIPEVIGQLRQRIRDLEMQVHERNVQLQDKDRLKRNYKALLDNLVKVKAEKTVIEEDREKFYKEMKFYRNQAEKKTEQNEVFKERLHISNEYKIDSNKKLKQLEKEICFWKRKCENHEAEDKENQARPIQQEDTAALCNRRSADSHCPPKRRRHTFYQSPTVLPRCKNCLAVFDRQQPHEIQCTFHRSGPQPLKTWRRQLDEDSLKFDQYLTEGHLYWPCCGKTGLKEPPGCLKLRSHDLILPEDE